MAHDAPLSSHSAGTRTSGVHRRMARPGLKTNVMRLLFLAVTAGAAGCARSAPTPEPEPIPAPDRAYFEKHQLMVPVDGYEPGDVDDTFNASRDGGRTHRATDILAPLGTPVLAAIDGEVMRLSQSPRGGITAFLIDDERRYIYYYAHLERYSPRMTVGLRVRQGHVIGYVGTSGNAPRDTPHLHFQAMRFSGQRDWWNGRAVDVRSFMTRPGQVRE